MRHEDWIETTDRLMQDEDKIKTFQKSNEYKEFQESNEYTLIFEQWLIKNYPEEYGND